MHEMVLCEWQCTPASLPHRTALQHMPEEKPRKHVSKKKPVLSAAHLSVSWQACRRELLSGLQGMLTEQ